MPLQMVRPMLLDAQTTLLTLTSSSQLLVCPADRLPAIFL